MQPYRVVCAPGMSTCVYTLCAPSSSYSGGKITLCAHRHVAIARNKILVAARSLLQQDHCCSKITVAACYELLCCVLFRFFAEQGGSEGFFGVPETAAHAAQIVFDDWG